MKALLIGIPTLLLGLLPSVFADVIVPGTQIQVRSDGTVDVSRWDRGRIYPAHVAQDVYDRDGDVAIPRGSYAELIVRRTGPDQYTIDLESVTVHDRRYVMDTSGPQYNMPQNEYNNGNGLVGSIIGAIAGANGQTVQSNGGEVRVPGGSLLTFQLQEPLHTVNWYDPGYDRDGNHYHHDQDWYR